MDDPSKLPDGNTPGTSNVDNSDISRWHTRSCDSTCNDKSRKDNNAYEPTTEEVTKDYGTPTTE